MLCLPMIPSNQKDKIKNAALCSAQMLCGRSCLIVQIPISQSRVTFPSIPFSLLVGAFVLTQEVLALVENPPKQSFGQSGVEDRMFRLAARSRIRSP
jgi:hypothetical protein